MNVQNKEFDQELNTTSNVQFNDLTLQDLTCETLVTPTVTAQTITADDITANTTLAASNTLWTVSGAVGVGVVPYTYGGDAVLQIHGTTGSQLGLTTDPNNTFGSGGAVLRYDETGSQTYLETFGGTNEINFRPGGLLRLTLDASTGTLITGPCDVTTTLTTNALGVTTDITTDTLTATGAIGGLSLAATNGITADTVTATNGISGNTITSTTTITGNSIASTTTLTADSVTATNAVSGNTVVATDSVTGNTVSGTTSISTPILTATNYVNIGGATHRGDLSFPATDNFRKITFYTTADNDYQFLGFGQDTAQLTYHVNNTGTDHVFYAGTSASARSQLLAIKGNNTSEFSGPLLVTSNSVTDAANVDAVHVNFASGTGYVQSGNFSSGTYYPLTIRASAITLVADKMKLPVGASDPAGTPVEGEIYYNTTSSQVMVYDGSAWSALDWAP